MHLVATKNEYSWMRSFETSVCLSVCPNGCVYGIHLKPTLVCLSVSPNGCVYGIHLKATLVVREITKSSSTFSATNISSNIV